MDSIINGLTSDDPKIREAAFETAAESTDASVADRLIELVQAGTSGEGRTSTKGNLREAAAIALGRSTNERAGSFLLGSLGIGLIVQILQHLLQLFHLLAEFDPVIAVTFPEAPNMSRTWRQQSDSP